MPPFTLLQYLTEPNPTVDHRYMLGGLPTKCQSDEELALKEWTEFDFQTLMSCYGHVLREQFDRPFPEISPPVKTLECQLVDEDTLDHLLSRSIIPAVSESLSAAWHACYRNHLGEVIDITRGGHARRNRNNQLLSEEQENRVQNSNEAKPKIFPDWAGVSKSEDPFYTNLCPGETKLGTKWDSQGKGKIGYYWPIAQVLKYCVTNWNCRYGYIITERELVVLRFSREKIGSGLALGRAQRTTQPGPQASEFSPQHHRQVSLSSEMSHMSLEQPSGSPREASTSPPRAVGARPAQSSPTTHHHRNPSTSSGLSSSMSLDQSSRHSREPSSSPPRSTGGAGSAAHNQGHDSTSSGMSMGQPSSRSRESSSSGHRTGSTGQQAWEEGNSGGDYRPVEWKSIPWSNSGPGKMTVKLALWWIHMLAGAPDCDKTVGNYYDPLDTWIRVSNNQFKHISTGLTSKTQPQSGHIRAPSEGPSTPPQNPRGNGPPLSSPLSSPPSSMQMSTPPDINPPLPTVENIANLQWDHNLRQWRFITNSPKRSGAFPRGRMLWSSRNRGWYHPEQSPDGRVHWVADTGRSEGSDNGSDRSRESSASGKGKGVDRGHRKDRRQ
ncbi:hypothetical protein FQN54_004595 [Arachnomyces sp. PD_36]|nr:hypothetical protein FQN54_004595 [Arachnomyces sp. PD_36]